MVGIVAVSHSRALAQAAVALAREMIHREGPPIAVAAGLDAETFGTDAMAVREAIESVDSADGVVVVMDLGSAVLSTDLALDLLDPETAERVEVTAAPFVEGLVAAVVQAATGATRGEVAAEAAAGLTGKMAHFGHSGVGDPLTETEAGEVTAVFTVTNDHGLHARPAARLVGEVNRYNARASLRNLATGTKPINAGSLSRVAALGATKGSELEIAAAGPQAAELVEAVVALASRRFDETGDIPETAPEPVTPGSAQPASPGIAIGPKFTLTSIPIELDGWEAEDPGAEWRKLREALAAVRTEIARVRLRVSHDAGDEDAAIFDAHLMLLEDRDLLETVRGAIDKGIPAPEAWRTAIKAVESDWAALDDPYMNARAVDVRSVGDQVLRSMLGVTVGGDAPEGILVAEDLTPADTADLDPTRVLGVVTGYGSPTSHSAILARSLGIPAVVAAGRWVLDIADGATVVVDGSDGTVVAAPGDDVLAEYRDRAAEESARRHELEERAHQPAVTTDGVSFDVEANVSSVSGAAAAMRGGADGIGLLRTEFLFLGRTTAPGVDEQEAIYRSIAEKLDGRRLTVRTLDVGGDKPLPYAPTPAEANPFLGMRGLRLSLRNPEVLDEQLQAICRVAGDHPVAVMFPMVSGLDEVLAGRSALDKAAADVGVPPQRIEMGIMIEVPSAALNASVLAPHVEFFSIGTNDLTQYTLAAERGNEAVASLADPLDPSVLRLVDTVCRVGSTRDVRVAVCGEVAADPVAVPILAGLGVGELSVSPPSVALVKDTIRAWSDTDMRRVAARALDAATADEVRSLS